MYLCKYIYRYFSKEKHSKYFNFYFLVIYRGQDSIHIVSPGEKIGEDEVLHRKRRLGTLQTHSKGCF